MNDREAVRLVQHAWTSESADPATRLRDAEFEITRQEKVIAALMKRVERDVDSREGLFASALALDDKVRARNRQLARALVDLRRSNDELASASESKQELLDQLEASNESLMLEKEERLRMESELMLAHKLEAVGQLAAGIAHEINTPIQFIGDSAHFLARSTPSFATVFAAYRAAVADLAGNAGRPETVGELDELLDEQDLEFTLEEMPRALERIAQGVQRVSVLVKAMKEFGHPGQRDQVPAQINDLLDTTLTVARNEYKYVADIETEFGDIPQAPCVVSEINQVFLNLIVNAAHAIAEKTANTDDRGRITIRTRLEEDDVVVEIGDTGNGIPESIQARVFDPFFTTKAPGKGTGQGLSIARSIVVDRHGGSLTFTSTPGVGTTFAIRIPTASRRQPAEEAA